MLKKVLAQLDAQHDDAVARLSQWLSIPSISTDAAYKPDVRRAAEWLSDEMAQCGLAAQVHETSGHPIVVGRTDEIDPSKPYVLFYGHYDVQPPDPVEGWTSPPFEPAVRDGKLFARGAADDKGQVYTFIAALRAWHSVSGQLPVNVSMVIEGEEECGSKNMATFIAEHADKLGIDPANTIVVISDTTMWDADTVAITYGLRGLLYYDIKLHGPNRDLHSGVFGGAVANPLNELTRVLAALFDEGHNVEIPGFYDDVVPLGDDERKRWAALGFDEKEWLNSIGYEQGYGEANYETLERRWARPSCDINGLYGGYGGEGAKTVIPKTAGAKVSFRLAPDQNPAKIATQFEAWLRSFDTHGCTWELTNLGEASPAMVATDSPYLAAAHRAVTTSSGKPPVLVREGATIPVVADFKSCLGLDSLLIGFGLLGDAIHAPDEHLGIDRFVLGCRTHAALLDELARL